MADLREHPAIDFTQPCADCRDGRHDQCCDGLCGCIAAHPDDEPMIRGFKKLKRQLHPEREQWTKGGWA